MAVFVFFAGTAGAEVVTAYARSGFDGRGRLLLATGRGCRGALSGCGFFAGKCGARGLVVGAGACAGHGAAEFGVGFAFGFFGVDLLLLLGLLLLGAGLRDIELATHE